MSFFRCYLLCLGVNHQKPGVQTAVITDGITEMNSWCTKCFILSIELGNPSFTATGIFYHLLILSFIRTSVLLYLCHLLLWTYYLKLFHKQVVSRFLEGEDEPSKLYLAPNSWLSSSVDSIAPLVSVRHKFEFCQSANCFQLLFCLNCIPPVRFIYLLI